jgi:hypothetical protein
MLHRVYFDVATERSKCLVASNTQKKTATIYQYTHAQRINLGFFKVRTQMPLCF